MTTLSSLRVSAAATALTASLASAGALAAEPYEPMVHDGFYMRFGSGLAGFDERLSSEDSAIYGGEIKTRTRGIGTAAELAIGGTISKGVVLGGAFYTFDLLTSTLKFEEDSAAGQVPPPELDTELRNLVLLAPFVDIYPNPRRGFHVQGALGLAVLTPRVFGSSATEQSEYAAIGGGLMLGAGYEWFVADEWSLGILGRATINVLTGKDDSDVRWIHVPVTSPSFLVTLTYH
jgi:hypothetical protein